MLLVSTVESEIVVVHPRTGRERSYYYHYMSLSNTYILWLFLASWTKELESGKPTDIIPGQYCESTQSHMMQQYSPRSKGTVSISIDFSNYTLQYTTIISTSHYQ